MWKEDRVVYIYRHAFIGGHQLLSMVVRYQNYSENGFPRFTARPRLIPSGQFSIPVLVVLFSTRWLHCKQQNKHEICTGSIFNMNIWIWIWCWYGKQSGSFLHIYHTARVLIFGMCWAQVFHVEIYRRPRIPKFKRPKWKYSILNIGLYIYNVEM